MVANLRRVFRLWALYAWLDFTWVTRDLKFAGTYFLSDVIINATMVGGVWLLAERFDGIGAWSRDQVIFMLGYGVLSGNLVYIFFGYNVSMISRRLGRGQLDHALVQPQPIWLGLLTDGFNPISGSGGLIPSVGLLIWSSHRLGLTMTPAWMALFTVNLAASCTIVLAFQFIWGSLAFWAPRAAEEINSSTMRMLDQLKSFPLDGLGVGLVGGLLSVVPVGLVAWFPSRALLGLDSRSYSLVLTPLAAIVLAGVAIGLFRKGMVHYGRTGSQRYLSLGHRS